MNLTLVEALKLASDIMLQGVLETIVCEAETKPLMVLLGGCCGGGPCEVDRCGCEDS